MLIPQRTDGQATCLCDRKIIEVRLFLTSKMFYLDATSSLATSKFYKIKLHSALLKFV